MSSSHFSTSSFAKPVDDDLSSLLSENVKKTIYSDPISQKPSANRLTGLSSLHQKSTSKPPIRRAGFSVASAFDRHKQLVNNYLTYYGAQGRAKFKPDTSKYKRDIDVVRENHRFLWEDEEGEEIDHKQLKWEQRIAKKYWEKLFKEYAITDLTQYKKNRIAFRWRTEKEVVDGKGQFICGQKKTCSLKEGLRTWEVNFGYVEEGAKKFALVKVRLCAECSAKLNHNKKYREVRKEQNRLAILREKEERVKAELDRKVRSKKREREAAQKSQEPEGKRTKTKLTEKQQQDKIKEDEESLRDEEHAEGDIWEKPAHVEEDKTKEQEFDEYFQDLFL